MTPEEYWHLHFALEPTLRWQARSAFDVLAFMEENLIMFTCTLTGPRSLPHCYGESGILANDVPMRPAKHKSYWMSERGRDGGALTVQSPMWTPCYDGLVRSLRSSEHRKYTYSRACSSEE